VEYPWLSSYLANLYQSILNKKPSSPLLIEGIAGLGKWSLARKYGQMLLCPTHSQDEHCVCRACQLMLSDVHPDLLAIEPEDEGKLIGVDSVRSLLNKLSLSPHCQGSRVVLVRQAEFLTIQAANAFLKFVEEPGANIIIAMTLDLPGKVPLTLRSRCQKMSIGAPPQDMALEFLRGKGVTDDAVHCIKLAGGAPIRALSIFEANSMERRKLFLMDWISCGAGVLPPALVADRWNGLPIRELALWIRTWLLDTIRSTISGEKTAPSLELEVAGRVSDIHGDKLFEFLELIVTMEGQYTRQLNNQMMLEFYLCKWRDINNFSDI